MTDSHQLLCGLCGVQQQPTGDGCALQSQALLELGQLAAAAIAGLSHQQLGVAVAGFDEIAIHERSTRKC